MTAPLAVSTGNPYPGIHLKVDLLRGSVSAGIPGLRACIISPRETGQGTMAVNAVEPVFSEQDVRDKIGRGLGYFAYKALFAHDKEAVVDLIRCSDSAGATATQTLTFTGTPTSNCGWILDISGHEVEIEWAVGVTDDDAAIDNAARINAIGDRLYCIASTLSEVITLTARAAGPAGNDVKLSLRQVRGTGGTLTLGGASLAGGTTEIDMTAALAAAQVKEYDYILLCMSQADSVSASASSNPARLQTHIGGLLDGINAKLQQGVYASTSTRTTAATNTSARNSTNLQHVCFQNTRDLPCEVAAAEIGDRMKRRRRESNANRVNQPLKYLRGAADKVANTPTDTQFTASTNLGVTNYGYDASGNPVCIRPITTYHKDGSGNQDRRCFDVNEVDTIYDYVKDLRTALPAEFMAPDEQVKVMRDRKPGDDPLPENTVEERDIKAFIVARTISFWVPKGAIQGPAFEQSVADGSLIVEVNDTDETQVDIFIPAKAVKILAKLGLFVAKEG